MLGKVGCQEVTFQMQLERGVGLREAKMETKAGSGKGKRGCGGLATGKRLGHWSLEAGSIAAWQERQRTREEEEARGLLLFTMEK